MTSRLKLILYSRKMGNSLDKSYQTLIEDNPGNKTTFVEKFIISAELGHQPITRYLTYAKSSGIPYAGLGIYVSASVPKGMYMDIAVDFNRIVDPMLPEFLYYDPHWESLYRQYHDEEDVRHRVNCKLIIIKDRILVMALRDIAAHEELLRCHSFAAGLLVSSRRALYRDNIVNYVAFLKWWLSQPENQGHKVLQHTYQVFSENLSCLQRSSDNIWKSLEIIKARCQGDL